MMSPNFSRIHPTTVILSLASCVATLGACKNPQAADGTDAATYAAIDAGVAPAAPMASDTPDASDAPSVAPSALPSGNAVASGGPFQGVYKCLGDLRLTQHGSKVTGESTLKYNPHLPHEVVQLSCTVAGDKCLGTSQYITEKEGKQVGSSHGETSLKLT